MRYLIEKFFNKNGSYSQSTFTKALDAMVRGEKSKSIGLLKDVVKNDTNHIQAYLQLGNILRDDKPEQSLNQSINKTNFNGVLIDKNVKNQLNLNLGDMLNLGDSKIIIKGILKKEPDRMFSFATFGSRVLLSIKTLQKTNLIIPGSLVKYKIKFIPNEKNINLSYLIKLVEGTNISIRDVNSSTNNFNNFIERTSLFISMVGLITLLFFCSICQSAKAAPKEPPASPAAG